MLFANIHTSILVKLNETKIMTKLSVNLNKIALLRNSRGRDFPNVVNFANKFMALGVQGITVHPRQDERHITMQDAHDLGELLKDNSSVEYNIEGYPSEDFLQLVEKIKPTQCTLVPDAPGQLTSDHGWDLSQDMQLVQQTCARLKKSGIRAAIFLDPSVEDVTLAAQSGCDRVEFYTESFAASYHNENAPTVFKDYQDAVAKATALGIEVNAGHDLDLQNLAKFLSIPAILEVSIGHVLTVECIEQGMQSVVAQYLEICEASA
ncbi:MAG: pyridoxal phosphate biosynthesis protein [Osedax symbiont Rs2]|nr:MAG: pyridoxal phosphate biosynthesis protein [Osedax symbiont Rs2]